MFNNRAEKRGLFEQLQSGVLTSFERVSTLLDYVPEGQAGVLFAGEQFELDLPLGA